MKAVRKGHEFDVMDDPWTRAWNFWEEQFPEVWEPWTFDLLDDTRGTFVDVGAWVGPFTIWARRPGLNRRVVAVEPDPLAFAVLQENMDDSLTTLYRVAVTSDDGHKATLSPGDGGYGNSTSRLGSEGVRVWTARLSDIIPSEPVGLVKIDTEGSEADILPANADLLHGLGCPVVVSLHLPWLSGGQKDALWDAVNTFHVETLDATDPAFPTLLLT